MPTNDEIDEMDLSDVLNEYINEKKFHSFEGSRGVKRLEELVTDLNQDYQGRFSGTSITDFLEDNPGAIEAIIDWISEQNVDEWKENLASHLTIDEDEENDEEE